MPEISSATAQPDAEALYVELLGQMRATLDGETLKSVGMVGIHSGGVWLAERLHRDLGLSGRIGTLDISFYRDDYQRIGLPPQVRPTDIPFEVDGRPILLVDDILYTGRTLRGAMNTLFDYGRPARIDLAVLLDRGGRELPVEARWKGGTVVLPPGERFVLGRSGSGGPDGLHGHHGPFTLTLEPIQESA